MGLEPKTHSLEGCCSIQLSYGTIEPGRKVTQNFFQIGKNHYFCDMETVIAIIAILLGIGGIIGSIVPGLPGPPVSWVGILVLYIWGSGTMGDNPMSLSFLLIWLAITVVVTILDYIVPGYFTKVTGGSKWAGIGTVAGLIIGMFFSALGMIIGALLGAFVAEMLIAKKDTENSIKSALGAFLGFIFGIGLKLTASGVMMYYIIAYAF